MKQAIAIAEKSTLHGLYREHSTLNTEAEECMLVNQCSNLDDNHREGMLSTEAE